MEFGFQRLRYHIDLHDCKVIGLRWLSEADLLYDKGEASADAAWRHGAWAAEAERGSWHWTIGRFLSQ